MKKVFFILILFFACINNIYAQSMGTKEILQEVAEIIRSSGTPAWGPDDPWKQLLIRLEEKDYRLVTYTDSLLLLELPNGLITYELQSKRPQYESCGLKELLSCVNAIKETGTIKIDSLCIEQNNEYKKNKMRYETAKNELRKTLALCVKHGIKERKLFNAKNFIECEFWNLGEQEILKLYSIRKELLELIEHKNGKKK